jgi:XRE family transcriptional regulator, regulator of sulfur utilization
MKLEERFRELRIQKELTLKDLATMTELSVSYLSDIERGRTTPSLNTLEILAQAFKLTVADLLSGVDFAGDFTGAGLPEGLRELLNSSEFKDEIDKEWVTLLSRIELRGARPQSKQDWLELYLHLRRILHGT